MSTIPTNIHNEKMVELYHKILQITNEKGIPLDNVSEVTKIAMENIDSVKNLNGDEKREFVIQAITKIIENKFEGEKKNKLLEVVKVIVPNLIETFILISKGNLVINKVTFAHKVLKFFMELFRGCKK